MTSVELTTHDYYAENICIFFCRKKGVWQFNIEAARAINKLWLFTRSWNEFKKMMKWVKLNVVCLLFMTTIDTTFNSIQFNWNFNWMNQLFFMSACLFRTHKVKLFFLFCLIVYLFVLAGKQANKQSTKQKKWVLPFSLFFLSSFIHFIQMKWNDWMDEWTKLN